MTNDDTVPLNFTSNTGAGNAGASRSGSGSDTPGQAAEGGAQTLTSGAQTPEGGAQTPAGHGAEQAAETERTVQEPEKHNAEHTAAPESAAQTPESGSQPAAPASPASPTPLPPQHTPAAAGRNSEGPGSGGSGGGGLGGGGLGGSTPEPSGTHEPRNSASRSAVTALFAVFGALVLVVTLTGGFALGAFQNVFSTYSSVPEPQETDIPSEYEEDDYGPNPDEIIPEEALDSVALHAENATVLVNFDKNASGASITASQDTETVKTFELKKRQLFVEVSGPRPEFTEGPSVFGVAPGSDPRPTLQNCRKNFDSGIAGCFRLTLPKSMEKTPVDLKINARKALIEVNGTWKNVSTETALAYTSLTGNAETLKATGKACELNTRLNDVKSAEISTHMCTSAMEFSGSAPTSIAINSQFADTHMWLPNTAYHSTLQARLGDVKMNIPSDPASKNTISGILKFGTLTVDPPKAGESDNPEE